MTISIFENYLELEVGKFIIHIRGLFYGDYKERTSYELVSIIHLLFDVFQLFLISDSQDDKNIRFEVIKDYQVIENHL